ncbi:mitochondrial glycerol-3-phosphate dehydrogenase [Tulasnella sp. 330]|nr:mitochondrial glycerol-3-phosphate dehydrogenase [Tulasnella sp. 330]KAG8881875.1 mitochondrial glycerol-3-phosphate dehydrogenase [Tulasnella sp. 332]
MFGAIGRQRLAYVAAAGTAGATTLVFYNRATPIDHKPVSTRPPPPWTPPSRLEMIQKLKDAAKSGEEFDLLVVGGGATGAGVAVDAATRGLKVALVDRDDFASGTSSKSTKLVHGGVRYLEKAVWELDYEQYKLVREALHERRVFLTTAPYLSHMLPIMLPVYKWWKLPYYWAGCKAYDILAGKDNMESSYLMSKGKAMAAFPMIKSDGLVGAVVYYDGQHNDSRMNMALIMTAVKYGAVVSNYMNVSDLTKDANGKVVGAEITDVFTGEKIPVKAKGVINATGPFSDELLAIENPGKHKPIVAPSSGVHITLPKYYAPQKMGLLDAQTSDGRVIFFLPWQGNVIAGTTDSPSPVERDPKPSEEDVEWVLDEVRRYLSPDIHVRRGDVLSAWSGLRPLVRDPKAKSSQALVRNHLIHISESGLITVAGGKWTTYREMAEDAVNQAIKTFDLKPKNECITHTVKLVGTDGWSSNMYIRLIQSFGIETQVAQHLSESYGDRAWTVLSYASSTGQRWPLQGVRLINTYPYIEAEVHYACAHEFAQTAVDFIARRSRLSFLNAGAALDALPRVIQLMGDDLGWDSKRRRTEWTNARDFLVSMGLPPQMDGELDQVKGTLGDVNPLTNKIPPAIKDIISSSPLATSAPLTPPKAHHSRGMFSVADLEKVKKEFADKTSITRNEVKILLEDMHLFETDDVVNMNDIVDGALHDMGIKRTEKIGFEQFWQARRMVLF